MNHEQLEAMLRSAAQRMGTTPDALQRAAQNGDLSSMLGRLDQNQAAAMEHVLSDPEAAKKLLSTPQAQALLRHLGQGNAGT